MVKVKVKIKVNGSQSATIKANFDSFKLTPLLSCGVQSVSSFPRHLRCIVGKTRGFPDVKNKRK